MEDDFGRYMGNLMATTIFFLSAPVYGPVRRFQVFVRGSWNNGSTLAYSSRVFYFTPEMGEQLHCLLDFVSISNPQS
jgi:hypothetical protein